MGGLASAALISQAEEAAPRSPSAQIESFHKALLASARLSGGFDDRLELLGPEFDRVFDLSRIARISIGASWRELDDAAKHTYQQALRSAVLSTYVVRFDADRGQQLRVLQAREVKPGRDLVRAEIVRPNGKRVSLDYYLRDRRVFNVEADGVSDLSIRRADYTSLIKTAGFDALLEHLRNQFVTARSTFAAARE